jgi:hypothetical protein
MFRGLATFFAGATAQAKNVAKPGATKERSANPLLN